jgi:hexaprenyl-diphosphate synthase
MGMLGSSHPGLTEIASYYFLHPSKQLRPLLVLLWSQATNGLGHDWRLKSWAVEREEVGGRGDELDRPLTRPDVLNDWNPNMPDHTASFESVFALRSPRPPSIRPIPPPELLSPIEPRQVASSLSILSTQMRLAQIVEMIHVASLLHDDVIDESPLRRGAASAPAAFGNKFSILGGDFLLGRASAALSRLDSVEVVELISSVVANLVEGEILQMKAVHGRDESERVRPALGKENWNIYLRKTYLKTASLMAKGARAAVVLGGCREGEIWKEVAYAYGRNLGIAFQVIPTNISHERRLNVSVFSSSSWTISWITNPQTARWANLAVPIYNSVSRRAQLCSRGRSIQSSARSSSASSKNLEMWSWSVDFSCPSAS